ncbi:MAG: hypothetical protein IPK82_29295 [Polyangiaceae bacterium]|nr:hypothetical protein [Polyangiaceae bacterium]
MAFQKRWFAGDFRVADLAKKAMDSIPAVGRHRPTNVVHSPVFQNAGQNRIHMPLRIEPIEIDFPEQWTKRSRQAGHGNHLRTA